MIGARSHTSAKRDFNQPGTHNPTHTKARPRKANPNKLTTSVPPTTCALTAGAMYRKRFCATAADSVAPSKAATAIKPLRRAGIMSSNFDVYDRNVRLQPDVDVVYLRLVRLKAASLLRGASCIPDIGGKQTNTWNVRAFWYRCAQNFALRTTAI